MRTPLDDGAVRIGDGSTEPICGSTMTIDTTRTQADILILLDRSASMDWSLTSDSACRGANCSTRAAAVVSALEAIVVDNPDISWGLELLPTPNGSYCSVSRTPQVGVSSSSASAIRSQLAGYTTALSTPTAAAVNAATAYLKTVGDGNRKAILLATDGLPNCASGQSWATEDMIGATAAVTAAKNAGFPVYVIGIGPSTSISNLNVLAEAGATGSYYPATSTTALDAALSSIAKVVSSTCTFKANTTPPDTTLVVVYVDKNLVAQSDSEGWMFDPADTTYSTIILTGSYCQNILAGLTSQVQIVFGCPEASSPDTLP
jgi:hypothetical protein